MSGKRLKAGQFKTDKSQQMLDNYGRWFGHLQNKPIRILEVGVLHGGSLQLWRSYFSKGQVIGVDRGRVELPKNAERLKVYQGLQQDADLLNKIARENAPKGFDIIIDDASHVGELTRRTFEALFDKHLKPGGIYVIEDWGTGYWQMWPDGQYFTKSAGPLFRKNKHPSHQYGMVGFIKQLVDEQGMADITHRERGRGRGRQSKFDRMEITHAQVAIFKAKP